MIAEEYLHKKERRKELVRDVKENLNFPFPLPIWNKRKKPLFRYASPIYP